MLRRIKQGKPAPPSPNNVGPDYWKEPHYQTPSYRKKLESYRQIERNRQDLISGRPTAGALAYARFLNAIENDATLSNGGFKKFECSDGEVARAYPFLKELLYGKPKGLALDGKREVQGD